MRGFADNGDEFSSVPEPARMHFNGLTISAATAGGAGPAGFSPAALPAHAGVSRHDRVLVVDDDPDVAEVAAAVLEGLGLTVEICGNADSALRRVEEDGAFDLVFSDIVMPGAMNGLQLAAALRARFPALPVLLATGYSNAALAPEARSFTVLAKPYSVTELSRVVSRMIGKA